MNEPPGDEILLEGMCFYAYHGVNPEEKAQGQRFVVDVALRVDLRAAGQTDDVAQTVSYSAVYKRVKAVVEGLPRDLIETVAEELARVILAEFPAVERATVVVRKPEAPIAGAILDAAGVRIVRARRESAS